MAEGLAAVIDSVQHHLQASWKPLLAARGVFTSVTDLSRKIMKYIRAYAKSAKPFNWKYTDFCHRMVKK